MSLRAELLAAAVAQRDQVLASLDPKRDRDLLAVARREWAVIVDKLANGEPYRLTPDELPAGHPLRRRAHGGDVLVLDGDDELVRAA